MDLIERIPLIAGPAHGQEVRGWGGDFRPTEWRVPRKPERTYGYHPEDDEMMKALISIESDTYVLCLVQLQTMPGSRPSYRRFFVWEECEYATAMRAAAEIVLAGR